MNIIWTPNGNYSSIGYVSEAELETSILKVKDQMFGPERIYLDIKKR
jgi:hypothetical protein